MKSLHKTIFSLIAGITISTLGCNDPLNIDINIQQERISLYSQLNPSLPITASLYKSKNITDSSGFEFLEHATIILSEGGHVLDTLKFTSDLINDQPYWKSNIIPVPGLTYTLQASSDDLQDVNSSALIPDYKSKPTIFYKSSELKPVSLGGNYKIIELSSTIHLPEFPNDSKLYSLSMYIEKGNLELIDDLPVIKSYSHAIPIIFSSKSASDFLGVGLDKSILIRKDYWDNNRDIDFRIRYIYNYLNEKPLKVFYEWRTLSQDYYDYHYALSRQNINDPFSEPVTIFNNIVNGYGNFAGFNFHRDSLLIVE